ncbi:FHA domain-containing protein [Neorhodopirellula pilleata]|uniref:FHA domain protein n=1 Tax=Neorhodopirellula pilleata TaxID=2714738 RepID=A0A5C6AXV7_9BACT|nr:FHA domain-containing protein [Neorhodopirellula pilleata]TWU04009.1 FHA domain protein [Neorhodopirellula pilleata]
MISYELIYRNGKQRGETVSVGDKRLVIGRSADCDLVLQTPDVSRKHCMIVRNSEGIYIRDLGSRNGTKVNGVDIANEKAVKLKHRDKLQVGKWKFRMIEHSGSSLLQPSQSAESLGGTNSAGTSVSPVSGLDSVGRSEANSGFNDDSPLQGDLLDELDAIAASLHINIEDSPLTRTAMTVRDVDAALLKEAAEAAIAVDKNSAAAPTEAKSGQDNLSSELKLPKEDPAGERADFEHAAAEHAAEEQLEDGAKREPAKLPSHLRPKGPIDSQDAAEQALRRMFGS